MMKKMVPPGPRFRGRLPHGERQLSGLSRGRVRETTDATRWLVVRARLLWRSRDGIGQTTRGDLPSFVALQRDNTPTAACLNIYAVYMSGSTKLLLELYLKAGRKELRAHLLAHVWRGWPCGRMSVCAHRAIVALGMDGWVAS